MPCLSQGCHLSIPVGDLRLAALQARLERVHLSRLLLRLLRPLSSLCFCTRSELA